NGSLLISPDRSILFTDPRYTIQARQESACQVRIARGEIVKAVLSAISRLGLKRIGYEPGRMTQAFFEKLKNDLPMRASLKPAGAWVEELRMVKSPAEIARIRRSVETNSCAFEQAVAGVRPGMREQDLAAELEYRMRRQGAEKPSFETIVASGARSAQPHA